MDDKLNLTKNKPLTLDEIKQMDGERVRVEESDYYFGGHGIVDVAAGVVAADDAQGGYWPLNEYGIYWTAYLAEQEPGIMADDSNHDIAEIRARQERAEEIINELHTERLDYHSEYLPLIDSNHDILYLLDLLEKRTQR